MAISSRNTTGSCDVQISKGDFGRKNVLEGRAVGIEDLNIGDFIHVYWFDHSRVPRGPFASPECPAHHYGIYAGIWSGKRQRKHLRLYFGDFMHGEEATYMDVLINEIEKIELIFPRFVPVEQIQQIRRYSMLVTRRQMK